MHVLCVLLICFALANDLFLSQQALQGQGIAPRLPLVLQDVRLLLLRLAHQESLSVDCGGGAARSNIQLIPYQLQVRVT